MSVPRHGTRFVIGATVAAVLCGGAFWLDYEPNPEPETSAGCVVAMSQASERVDAARQIIDTRGLGITASGRAVIEGDLRDETAPCWAEVPVRRSCLDALHAAYRIIALARDAYRESVYGVYSEADYRSQLRVPNGEFGRSERKCQDGAA